MNNILSLKTASWSRLSKALLKLKQCYPVLVELYQQVTMSYVIEMISEGEHQKQDFKMRIEDSRKIARTLVAFANTDGGRLLIGVKDNGNVSGIQPEEEFHMIEAAAEMYCKPVVSFTTQVWKANHRAVLEIDVEASGNRPHYAIDSDGEWHAYQRINDRNVRANGVLLKVWMHEKAAKPADFKYNGKVRRLFRLLRNHQRLSFRSITKLLRSGRAQTEELLAQLVVWEVIGMEFTDTGCYFSLEDHADDFERQHQQDDLNR